MVERRFPETESFLAAGSLLLFSTVTLFVMFNVVPAENEKYAMLMLGALIGIVKDTFGRYFQATKGAQEQRREAADVARTLADTAATSAATAAAVIAPMAKAAPEPVAVDPPRPDPLDTPDNDDRA